MFLLASADGDCSATLIAPRTLLTADHCISPGGMVARSPATSLELFSAVETQTWRQYRPDGGPADLALVLLDRAPSVAPLGWVWSLGRVGAGTVVRHVGYGVRENLAYGDRYTLATPITSFTVDNLYGASIITGTSSEGICYGDSGGPALLPGADGGPDRVLGVHSHLTTPKCPGGASAVVPFHRTFIEDWLRGHEDAGCPRDDRCVAGCAPVDPDCVCGADGQCLADCEDLLDPDCPPSCRPDGVCTVAGICPRLDDDCLPNGAACMKVAQCEGRTCSNDPQRPVAYCTFACPPACPAGFSCDSARGVCIQPQRPTAPLHGACDGGVFCLDGNTCVAGTCEVACDSSGGCLSTQVCRAGICAEPDVDVPLLPNTFPAAPEKTGCSAGAGAPFAWLVLAALWAKPRRMRTLLITVAGLLFIGCSSCKSASAAGRDYKKPPTPAKGMVPAPLISRGKSVESNLRMSSADKLTDGKYKDGAWAAKMPTAEKPAWVALELGPGPEKLLLAWTASGSFNHKETQYGGPGSYRIETSADSTNGDNGTWKVVATVPDNEYRTRAHGFDFKGQRWVRWVVTGPSKDTYQYGIQPDELDVHDITASSDDTWFFLGDSITAMAFNRNPKGQPSFAEVVAKKHPGYFPMQLNGGIGFEKSAEGLKRLPQLLKEHPDVKHWAIGYGTNDSAGNNTDTSDFASNLEQMVTLIKAAGKTPIFAKIPFAPEDHEGVPKFNEVIDAVTKKHGLTAGPDLYTWFKAHPDELEDKLHPNDKGVVSINRLWAQAVDGLY